MNYLGYIAGALVVGSLIPQVVKSWRTKSTKDISLWRYIVYVTGLVLWIAYAVVIHNGPVAITNGFGLVLALIVLSLKLKYG